MNKSDSERIVTTLQNASMTHVDCPEDADVIILNTCSIRKSAEDRVFTFLSRNKKSDGPTIGVTGCMVNIQKKKLSEKASFCFEIKDLENLPQIIGKQTTKAVTIDSADYLNIAPSLESKIHAYIPIMSGCDNFCSYCVVPYSRGREVSRKSENIIQEINELVKKGYKAFTLIGQNVNSYGKNLEEDINFEQLLRRICAIDADFWIWFVSSHPKDMSKELINTIAREQKLCSYIHFAVQSGSDTILKAMNRHYTHNHCIELTDYIKATIPNVSLSTDIIVGFPGETTKDFDDTLDLCKRIDFNMAYISRFSPRPGTKAALLEETVSPQGKKEREHLILDILKNKNIQNNKKMIGETVTVLIDKQIVTKTREEKNTLYIGKTAPFKTVKCNSKKPIETGQFVRVAITNARDWGFEGEVVRA